MKTTKFNLTTTAVIVCPAEPFTRQSTLHTSSGSSYVGGSDVSSTVGVHIPNGNTLQLTIPANEALYAASNSTSTLVVLDPGTVD